MTNEERVTYLIEQMDKDSQVFPAVLQADAIAAVPGLTKREYFALHMACSLEIGAVSPEKAARSAVEYADALIAELKTKK